MFQRQYLGCKRNKYVWCATDLFGKYAWVVPIKDKKRVSIVNAFQKITLEEKVFKLKIF